MPEGSNVTYSAGRDTPESCTPDTAVLLGMVMLLIGAAFVWIRGES